MSAIVWFLVVLSSESATTLPEPYPSQEACVVAVKQAVTVYPDGAVAAGANVRSFLCVPGHIVVGR